MTIGVASTLWLVACGASSASLTPRATLEAPPRVSDGRRPAVDSSAKQLPPPWSTAQLPAPWSSTAASSPAPSGAGQRVLETASHMIDEGTIIRGSCYGYVETVFDEAGYSGWRRRETVFRGRRNGPYADLDLIEAGDWLYIVNHPELTPVGTHSVIFVEWEDRALGYARTVSYVGGRQERPADYVGYDVSRTYRILRPVD